MHQKRHVSVFLPLLFITIAVLAATALLPGSIKSATASAPEAPTEVFISDEVSGMILSNARIFWHTNCGGEFNPARSRARSRATAGSTTRNHYYPLLCQEDRIASVNIAADSNYIYWLTGNGRVVRLHQSATSEIPSEVSQMETSIVPDYTDYIAVSSNFVYWSEGTKIFRAPKAGGARETVFAALGVTVTDLRTVNDDTLLFLVSGSGNHNLLKATNSSLGWGTSLVGGNVSAFIFNSSRIYYAQYSSSWGVGAMRVASKRLTDLGDYQEHVNIDGTGNPYVGMLALDNVNLYWIETRGPLGPLMRWPLAGGTAVQIQANVSLPYARYNLLSDGDYVYWGQGDAINRIATDSAAITLDLAADGLEIIQTIQNPSNDVTLVRGKKTYVRLYGRINSSSLGLTSINPWPPAQLVGTVSGTPLPGSPLLPLPGHPPILDRAVNRDNQGEGFWFELPPEWTEEATITLRGEINPRHVARETTYSNNTTTHVTNFVDKAPICVKVVPVRFTSGTIGAYNPSRQPLFDRAEVLLPTADLYQYWPGGNPMEEYEFPFSSGPYEATSGDDDTWKILFKLNVQDAFSDDPASCSSENGRVHYVAIIPGNHANRAVNGKALGNSLVFFANLGNQGDLRNSAIGGVTLAHELGHNYGRGHINCPVGDPAGVDGSYPYPVCQLDFAGPNAHMGFDPISRLIIPATEAGDLLSYAHRASPALPRWTSDYTFEGIMNSMNNRPGTLAAAGGSSRFLTAAYDAGSDTAEFAYAYELGGSALAKVQDWLVTYPLATDHEFWVYDAGDTLIDQLPAVVLEGVDEGSESYVFMALLPLDTAAARVELVNTSGTPQSLISMGSGTAVPTVSITAPSGGSTVGSTLTVTWDSDDADGDALRHTVRYSNDNGATWQVLVAETPFSTFTISSDGLPGSSGQSRIQVIASDGLHSATATSDAFTLTPKAPAGAIFFDTLSETGVYETAVAQQGESVIARAVAYDDEDGPLSGAALQWAVTGPVSRSGSGTEIMLINLPPGTYDVMLTMTDSDANETNTHGTLTVAPKYVPNTAVPMLDGVCDDAAYAADDHPLRLQYDDGKAAYVSMIHADNALYACFSGMPVGSETPGEWVGLRVDVNDSGGSTPQANDLGFFIGADGIPFTAHGDDLSDFVIDAVPQGLSGRIARVAGEESWSAELRIEEARLGGWEHQTAMKVSHYWRNFSGDDTVWPLESVWNNPSTWGAVVLGEQPEPVTGFQLFLPVVIRP
ncbi:MAG: hypothetical protein R3E31_23440 [Chloroflexota bacterium]